MSILSTLLGYQTKKQKRIEAIENEIETSLNLLARLEIEDDKFHEMAKILVDAKVKLFFLRVEL